MTSHIATLLRPLARSILFSRPKQSSKERQRDKQRETTAKLRREVTERLWVEAVAKAVGQ